MATFAIGDIHGCRRSTEALLATLNPQEGDTIVFLGDYIDRGPDSKGVIDLIRESQASGVHTVALKGNHEVLLLNAHKQRTTETLERWKINGGDATMTSFGLAADDLDGLPAELYTWLEDLPTHHQIGNTLFVHAGLNLKIEDPLADKYSMLWARHWMDEAVMRQRFPELFVVHGHTPQERWIIESRLEQQRPSLDIDAGCVYATADKEGFLCALKVEERRLVFQPNIEEISPAAN
jgi:serine/threonine protein phosphatase 1